jgi:hypothetical protein
MTTAPEADPTATAEAVDPMRRQEQLAGRVGRLRTRSGGRNLDRWLLLTGGALMPLGFLLIVLGWAGASHTPLLFEQIPYMISGGLLGVALVFAGGFVYFAYWMTLLVRESRTAREDLQASLSRLENLLASGAMIGGSFAPAGYESANGHTSFVATATGTMIHRPDCVAVANRDGLRAVSPDTPGYTACGLCEPLAVGH